jgi:hypothetical protein
VIFLSGELEGEGRWMSTNELFSIAKTGEENKDDSAA